MKDILNKIKKLSSQYHSEIIDIRRHLHQYPELSNDEYKTSEFVVSKLEEFGIPYIKAVFKTGVTALIKGKNPDSKIIALRADMDALPVKEINEVDYKSKNEGVMHACGHDVHMASLLGTAKILNEIKNDLEGSVKLIFQPAEELIPGGAKFMIEEGVFKNPDVDNIIGQHVFPELESGKIGMKTGKYMASTDEINIKIKGKGGHAAMPDLLIDPVLIASQIINSLQQVVSRNAPTTFPSVLSFGRFIADGTYNVIPDEVNLKGTFRTFDEKWRAKALKNISKIANSIAEGAGAECVVNISHGYPYLVNDKVFTDDSYKYAVEYLGKENVVELDLRMTGEDFSYFSREVPGCFYRLGTANLSKVPATNLHKPNFNVDEDSLETGMGVMAWITFNQLINNNK